MKIPKFHAPGCAPQIVRSMLHALFGVAMFGTLVPAGAQDDFRIDWWTVDAGGGTSGDDVFTVSGTAGQPDAGAMTDGTFTIAGGFWPSGIGAMPVVTNRIWVGPLNGDWFAGTNWSPAGVPDPYDTITFSAGAINLTTPVTIYGQLNWSGGTLNGKGLAVGPGGVVNLSSGGGYVRLSSSFTNAGTVNWVSGGLLVCCAGPLVNQAGGLWDIQCDQSLWPGCCNSPTFQFFNAGTLRKSVGTGQTYLQIPFHNSGALALLSGSVNFSLASSYIQTGATLDFGLSGVGRPTPLQVSGTLSLDGILGASLLNNYTPHAGDSIPLIAFDALADTFNDLNLPPAGNGLSWRVVYGARNVSLQVISNPSPTAQILGTVKETSGAPVTNLGVVAYTTNPNNTLFLSTATDSSGSYALNVTNGTWRCSLQGLSKRGYADVPAQGVVVNNANQTINFVVQQQPSKRSVLACKLSGPQLVFSWPVEAGAFQLRVTSDLSNPNSWTPVPTLPVETNGEMRVTAPVPSGNRFYRLSPQ